MLISHFRVSHVPPMGSISQALYQFCKGLSCPYSRWENWPSKESENLAGATQLVSAGALDPNLDLKWWGLAEKRFDNWRFLSYCLPVRYWFATTPVDLWDTRFLFFCLSAYWGVKLKNGDIGYRDFSGGELWYVQVLACIYVYMCVHLCVHMCLCERAGPWGELRAFLML